MSERRERSGCIPQIIAVVSILACVVVALLAFGVFRLGPLRSGAIQLEAEARPTTAKAGDVVSYTVTMYNVGVRDGLEIITVTDSLVGDLSDGFVSTLAGGTSDRHVYTRTVRLGDSDPLSSTISVYATGAGQVYSDTAVMVVDLLEPTVAVEASLSPEVAVRGETITYTISVANVGDLAVEVITVTDSLLGDVTDVFTATLPPGASDVQRFDWTVPEDEDDPLSRTVTVTAAAVGQEVSDRAAAEVSLLKPAVEVATALDPEAAVRGEVVTYTVAISNPGRIDLAAVRVTDSILGDLSPSFPDTLPGGASERRTFPWPISTDPEEPLERTVTVEAAGAGEDVSASSSAALVLAGLRVGVTGDAWVRAGEDIAYTVTITNTGSPGAPDLILDAITGSGEELTEEVPEACRVLASEETCTFTTAGVAPSGQAADQGAVTNEIEARYRPEGFDNLVVGAGSHTVAVFQVSVAVEMDGPAGSVAGSRVTYAVEVTNNGSEGAPDLILDGVTDAQGDALTVPGACDRLATGESCSFTFDAEVPADQDALSGQVEVAYRPEGYPDVISGAAEHTVAIFEPSVAVGLSGDALSQAGGAVTHRLTITNTSSPGAPDLTLDSATDSRGGGLAVPASCQVLAPEEVCSFRYDVTVPNGEDPLTTRVEVGYRAEGVDTIVTAAASHRVEIFQAGIEVEKSGPAEGIRGEDVSYTVDIANASSDDAPDLVLERIEDSLLGDLTEAGEGVTSDCPSRLASGESCRVTYTYVPGEDDVTPLVNGVTVAGRPDGFTNRVSASAEVRMALVSPWEPGVGLPDGVGLRTLAVCPADGDILYAGFGSAGRGVYRSRDGGQSWQSTGLDDGDVFGIAVDPGDCDVVTVGAWRDGVLRSDDGGESWEASEEGLGGAFVYAVTVDPREGDVLYAGTAQRGVFRSEDAGETWEAWGLEGLTVPDLSAAVDDGAIYSATWEDGVYRRERSGGNWSAWAAVDAGIADEHRQAFAVGVDPQDADTVFAATAAGGVYRTEDGGGTWERVLRSPRTAYAVAVAPGGSGVVYAGTAEGVYRSTEQGARGSWDPFNIGLDRVLVRDVVVGFDRGGVHLGTADGAYWLPR